MFCYKMHRVVSHMFSYMMHVFVLIPLNCSAPGATKRSEIA